MYQIYDCIVLDSESFTETCWEIYKFSSEIKKMVALRKMVIIYRNKEDIILRMCPWAKTAFSVDERKKLIKR